MILSQQTAGQPIAACAEQEMAHAPIPIVVNGSPLDFDNPLEISLQRRFFSFVDQHISLEHDLVLEFFLNAGVVRVKGWGIELSRYEAGDIDWDRIILRRFFSLHGKAETGSLDDADKEQWMSIVEQVDYQRFCSERAPEIYLEGTLINVADDGFDVRWHDGATQRIGIGVGMALRLLEIGELFGARVRFGRDNSIVSLAGITLIPKTEVSGETLWQSWGQVHS